MNPVRILTRYTSELERRNRDLQKQCDDLRAQVAGLQDAVRHADYWTAYHQDARRRAEAAVDVWDALIAERNRYQHEAEAARKRVSDLTIECGRLEGIAETANDLRAAAQRREDDLRALLYDCRDWFKADGIHGTKLGYLGFRERLDAALGDGPTYPYDKRPKEARERRKES